MAQGAHVALIISNGSPQLAFDNSASISVIDPTTLKVSAQLPAGVGQQVEPAWSLNGQHLAYSQNGQIVIVEPGVKGSDPAILTQPPAGTADRNPAFAPTNKAIVIAYVQRTGNAAHQLCFVSQTEVLAPELVHQRAAAGIWAASSAGRPMARPSSRSAAVTAGITSACCSSRAASRSPDRRPTGVSRSS